MDGSTSHKAKAEESYEVRWWLGGKGESSSKAKDEEEMEEGEKEGVRGLLYRRSFQDGPLFLHARPVSRLMNCIIGNPEYKLGFAITPLSPNG